MAGTENGGGDDALEALLGEVARAPSRSPASELHGRTLGRYRIDATLGRGGMGIVYRAFDTRLAREVAVKVLAPAVLGDPERRARFVREARVAASLEDASTAAVYDVGEEGEIVWIAMELVRGRALRTLIDEHPNGLPPEEAVRLGMQIAHGLAFAHDRGVVHRDLKPENVMVDENGRTKILDFGLAKLRDVAGAERSELSVEHGRVLGTPSYMSPEQAKGLRVDHRSDVFSLGVVLYEMLSGRRPFVGETTMEVLIAIDRDDPTPLGELRRDLDRRLVAVVDRCLAKRAEDRWQHARDVVTALERFEKGGRRRRPAAAYAGLIAVAALASVAIVGVRMSRIAPADEKATASASVPPAPLDGRGATLGCPPLEASGVEAPAGWLGAAAASIVCRRAVWMRGGAKKLTLAPAELLALPPTPSDDLDFDVYGAPDARSRAVASARARAGAWIDGGVSRTRDGFDVHLEMKAPDDRVLARGSGSGRSLLVAVRAAMTPLGSPLPPLDDEVARWMGFRDPKLALALEDYGIEQPMGTRTTFPELEARKEELGPDWAALAFAHALDSCAVDTNVAAPALERSSPSLFARTASARARVANDVGLPVADELHALAEREVSPAGRREILRAETHVRYASGDTERITAILLPIVQEDAREAYAWHAITTAAYGKHRSLYGYTKSFTAWVPEHPDAWNTQAHAMIEEERERSFAFYRRAYELGSDSPIMALNYVRRLIERGRRSDARSVAARLLAGGERQRQAAEAVLLLAEVGDARFGAAIDRGRALGEAVPTMGAIECSTELAFFAIMEMAPHVGRGTSVADALVERFVLAEPRRLTRGHFAAADATMVCGFARPALALTCLDRVERLVAEGWFREGVVPPTRELMTGLGHWLRGDVKQAALAWRPLLAARWWARLPYVVDAFERAGDEEAAERADAPAVELTVAANLAHVRAARRAAKRGDLARAKALAKHVIDAWGAADVPVDVLHDMRTIAGAGAASPAR